MAKKKLTVKELETTRKGINKDEEDEKKAKAQGVRTSAPVYTYKDTNVTASDVAKKFNVQLPNKNASTGSNNAPGANAKAPVTSAAYTNKVADMFEKSKLYAAQGPDYVIDLANSIISGAATKPDKGNLGALDIDSIHDMTKITSEVARMLTEAGIFNTREIATNPLYAHLAQQEYRKSLLPTLQGELTTSQKADEANKAAQAEYEAKLRGMNADYSKQAEKAAEWKNFFSLLGENPTLEDKLRAAGIATGQTYDMGVFRGMDKYTAYEKKQALDNWFAGLDVAALSAAPVVEEPEAPKYTSKTAGIEDEIRTLEKYINAYQTLEELTAYARSNPDFATASVYNAPVYEEPSVMERMFVQEMGGAYADDALAAYINGQPMMPQFMRDPRSEDFYKRWEEQGYNYMLDQDREIWNVLRTMDPAKADAYLQALSQIYLLPTRAQGYRSWDETVATNPWTAAPAWAVSVLHGVGNTLDVPKQFAEAWLGVDNPYSAAFDNLNRQGNTRGAQMGAIRESDMPDWLKTASEYAYQGVSGFADNTARLLATGMNPTASLIMAGLQASSHSLHESAGRDDVSSAAKIIKAIGAGAIEVGTEKIGLDALFDMGKTGAKKYLSVVLSELGEESLNAASEPALEAVVAFLFDHEADIKSGPEFFENLKDTAITTLISASLSGGGAVASEYLDTRSYGKGIVNNGDVDTIMNVGQSMPENSESKRVYDEITGKQGKGKKPSFYQFGQLTKAIVKDLGEERAAIANRVQDEAIAGRLQELGDDAETAKKNAPIIRKVYRGEKLTMDERAAVRWNDRADKVTKELIRENNYTGDQPVPIKWVKGMKETQASESADVIGKQLQVQVATVTPIGKAANRAEEAAKKRVPKRDGKPKLATDSHVTFRGADGSAKVSGDIMRFEESDEGMQVVVQTGKGKEGEQKVKLDDWISADGDGVATILSYIGDEQLPHSVTAEEANTLMQVYKHSGGNAKAVIQAFDVNYLAGYSGADQVGSVLDPALSKIAYENGKRDAEKDEAQRKQRASEYKALENPVAGWIGKVDGREQVKGLGDAKALEEALQAMPESQRTAAEIMIETGKAVGLNVVLYDSDGKGAANDIQNGMFDAVTHTVYFDVSAWAGNEKRVQALKKEGTLGYAMLRVGGHELTHYLEVAAPEAYAKYSKAVKDALKAKGVDFAVQMRERIDKANAQGRKLTMAGAAAEVIADASENMLQDSKLFNSLDTDTKGKIRAFLQNFAQKVKEIFQHLTGGHKESAALREMKNGVYHYLEGLQDLWDAGFDEILAKGTTDQSGDATEMVDSIPVEELEATRKFSMGRDVEVRDDDLIAVHNLKESDVMGTLDLGGFPMPSIAIVRAKEGHTMYGDYSVVFGKETIDPKADVKNRVYGADAWTPVFPVVETEILDDEMYEVQQEAESLAKQVDDEYGRKARTWFGNFGGMDSTTKTMEDIQDSAWHNAGMVAAYLADQGETVEILEKDVPVERGYNPARAAMYDQLLDIVDPVDIMDMKAHELIDTYGDRLAEAIPRPFARLNANWKAGDRQAGVRMVEIFRQAIAYEGSGRDTSEKLQKAKDYYATDEAMRNRVDRADFNAWVQEKMQRTFGAKGIYNGKNRFTPSGNRRSFKQIHDDVTAKNVVKSMASQQESNIPVTDAKGLMAAASSMYKSIAEIKGDVSRLGKISDEEYRARIVEANNTHHELLNALEAWDYDQIESVGELLVQAAKKRMSATDIAALLKKNGYKATKKTGELAADLIRQVQTIPSGYFEAKPARVVGFDEIRMIVAPDSMPVSLAKALDERGIPYTTYDGSDADRLEKVNAVEGVRFSDREDQTETEAFKRWFGDSVVVNRDGTPKVMYHGTTRGGFTVFDGGKDYYYFTDNRKYAYTFAGRKANGQYYPSTKEAEAEGRKKSQIYKVYLSVQNPYITDDVDIIEDALYWDKTLAQKLRDKGYDALMLPDMSQVIVLNPSQIKSATDNVGTFDPENPDIRYSDRDLPDGVTIREYLGAMKPTSSMTETEKLLLKRYQDQLRTLAEKEKLVSEQDEIIRNTPAGDELTKAKNRRKIYRDQADRAARAIANAEKDEGFARLMVTSRQVMNDYLTGAGGNVADASDALDSEVRALTDKLKKLEADITRSSDGQRAAFARGLFNPDELKAAAKILKSNYGSRMSVENIANRLALAYGELYAEEGAEGAKRFSEAARDLAVDLLKGNKFRYRSDILPTLQEKIGTISLSETDIQEIKHRGYTLREYKNMLSPYIKVTEGGSSISSYASNAQYYDDGTLTAILGDDTEGNLAMRLYDVISHEKAKEAEASYDGMTEGQLVGMAMADIASANLPMSTNDSTVEYLRKELLKYAGQNANIVHAIEEAISNAKQATRRASKLWHEAVKVSETVKQAVKYYRKLDEHRRVAELADQKRILTEQLKGDAAKTLKEMRARYQEQIDNIRLRRDINIDIGKKTRHIKRVVKALNDRIVHEEDYKNVKEPLKPAVHTLVRTFLDGFGNLVFDQKTADKLKSVYDVLAQDDATVEYYDDEVSDWLTTLAKLSRLDEERRAGGVTLESLNDKLYIYTTLADIADHVAHMVTAADTMFMEGRKASVSGVTEDIGNTLLAKEDRRELAGVLGKAANFVDNLIIRGNMMPQFFFEGLNNNGMMQLYDGLQDGVRMYSERLLTGENFLEDAMRRYGYHTWRDMDKVVEFKTQQGHTIHLKRENMMWIYATAKREASNPLMDTHHLDEGGFVYEESSAPTAGLFKAKGHQKHHKIVQEDVEAITAMLTAEQIAFMDECVEFLSTECAGWGNEASMQLFGIKKYKEKYYFPFKVDGGQLYKNSAAGSTSTTSDARVKHISFSHSIKKGANTPLVMGEFTSVIADHINQMATYSGMVVPIENMNRVLNRKVDDDGDMVTIRSLLGRKYGSPSSKYVDDLLKDLNGGPQTDNRGTWDAGIRLFKKNAVVGKMSVAIQQPTAITRAFAYINPRWFVNLHMERPKETWERMMKYSGTAVLKDMGGFNVGLGRGAKNWIERGDLGDYNVFKRSKFLLDQKGFKAAKDEWVDFLTGLPGWMDKVTWISIWNAAENEQAHQHPGMDRNSDEFLQMVGRRFDDIVNHTQVYDSILSKSQNMRSKNTLAKMATSFMAESTLNMNLAYRAFASRDVKQIGKVVSSLLLNAALGAAAYALVGSWNKDDDDRTWEEKYAVAFAGRLADNLNPMASIPYLSDIWNKIQGYDVERTDLSYVLDLAEDGMKFFDKMFNPDEALSYRDYENFVGGMFAAATGIPAKNWMGDARRIWNMTHTKNEDAPSSRVWYGILDEILPGRGTNNTAYYERLLAATMDGDKQEMYDLKDYLMATKGVKESTITTGVRDAYKKVYLRGGIDKTEAVNFLLANNLVTGKTEAERKQNAFEYVDKWEEGTEGYSAYNTLRKVFSDGNSASIQKAWDELEANGWSNDSIGSYVRNTIIKGMVTSGQITTSKATELIRKWYPYKKDNDNVDKPKEWLNSK